VVLLQKEFSGGVAMASVNHFLKAALKIFDQTSDVILFLEHLGPLLVEILVVDLEVLLHLGLVGDQAVKNMRSLGEVNVF
jgi:hypothetical protein